MRIRTATLNDRDQCLEIARQYDDTRAFGVPWYSGADSFERCNITVLCEGSRVLGFYDAYWHTRDRTVNLMYVALRPELVGSGFGALLVAHLLDHVICSDAHDTVTCKVSHTAKKTLSMFMRLGFEVRPSDWQSARLVWVKDHGYLSRQMEDFVRRLT